MKPKKRLLKPVILLLIVWLVSVSCVTDPEIIIVKEKVLPQEVTFPEFPIFYADQIEYSEEWVYVPEWLWMEIADYKLDVEKTEELYKLFRNE